MEYYVPGFHRVGFIEEKNAVAVVMSALEKKSPFTEMEIEGVNTYHEMYIGFALMVAFFLSVGLQILLESFLQSPF